MTVGLQENKLRRIQYPIVKGVVICTCATMLAITLQFVLDVKPVDAAAVSATTMYQDRRPDRERSVGTSSSGSHSSGRSRPRIVRR
jgi:hypothetical protein